MGRHSGGREQPSEDGDRGWRGGHRNEGGRRGVSVGVIVALVTVVVVIAGAIVWRFFGDVLSERSTSAAEQCVKGTATVAVIAEPSIADVVGKLGDSYNQQAKPVGDRCVKVTVKKADSDAVVNGFVSGWPSDLGDRPALWIPASSVSSARLQGFVGKETVSDARSLVTSPVMLAVPPQLKDALAQQNWAALPGLQTNPTGLDSLNLPGWGSLRLALPTDGDSDASNLAVEAVAAASAPPNSSPTAGIGAVNTLVAARPKLADDTADSAWNALAGSGDPATAPVHAVPITEQQLFQRLSASPDASKTVVGWLPPGPVELADYPTVLLAGSWLSDEQVSAASEFARFMRQPDQQAELATAGFRADGATPPQNGPVDFTPLAAPLTIGDDSVRATLARALALPATGSTTTIMLDQSITGLANVTGALGNRLNVLPPYSTVGLWTFNGLEGHSAVPTGLLSDQVNGQDRSAALAAALAATPETNRGASFTTLRMVYPDALANFRSGQQNSVLVITQGPHTDQTLDGPGLQQYLQSAIDQNRPVEVNVIDIGDDPDHDTWEAVAQLSGGTYQAVPGADSPDLAAAITSMLS